MTDVSTGTLSSMSSRSGGYRLVRPRPAPARAPVLDAAQRAVVDHPGGPLLVLAGPGTGKTTTLVESVADRVRRGARPDQVLVLTFSRKAADELRERVATRLGGALAQPSAWTFHAWCYAFVNAHARTPPDTSPRLVSGPERLVRVRELLEGSFAGEGTVRWPEALRPALRTRAFAGELADLLDRARERGLDPPALRALAAQAARPDWACAADFYEEYVAVLGSRGEMDYAELVRRALAVLEDETAVLEQVRERYRAVFVDEYQDTDPAQEHLLRLLAGNGGDLVVVGDPDQAIYRFRGADVSCLLEFPDRFPSRDGTPARVLALGTSRRFGGRLAEASRRIAERIPLPRMPVAARVAHRHLRPADGVTDAEVEVRLFATLVDEASAVADLLRREHLTRATPWREMAVLTRAAPHVVPTLRRALVAAGVPVAVAADELPVAEEPAVRPLLLALRGAVQPEALTADDVRTLLVSPLGRATAADLRRLGRALRAAERAAGFQLPRPSADLVREAVLRPVDLLLVDGPVAAPVRRVADALDRARAALARDGTVDEALWEVWDGSGWARRLAAASAAGGPQGRAADRDLDAVVALFDSVAELAERHPHGGVRTVLDELAAQEIPPQRRVEGRLAADGVRLLTAHRAKGLEWDLVVVAGVQEGTWPDLRRRGTLLEPDRIGAGELAGPGGASVQLAEERRLFYVAVTRARRRLVVTAVESEEAGERVSRFVGELGVPVPEPHAGRTELLALPSLVGRLRATVSDPSASAPLRHVAAAQLARLAADGPDGRPAVPDAGPERWWGLAEWTPGAAAVRRPDRPVALSASSVAAYDRCPLAWFLHHEAGGALPATASQGFGIVVHALAALVATGALPASAEAVARALDEVWAGLGFEAPWERQRERAAAGAALERLLVWQARTPRVHVASEVAFDVTLAAANGDGAGVRLHGAVDRLDRDREGRVHVVDYKTATSPPTRAEVDANPQLGVYQLVAGAGGFVRVLGPGDVRLGGAELVQLRVGLAHGGPKVQRQEPLDPGADGQTWVHVLVSTTAAGIRAERFPARRNDRCARCPFARSCPAHDHGAAVVE